MSFSKLGPWYVIDNNGCGLQTMPTPDVINLTSNTTGEVRVVGRVSPWGTFNGNAVEYQGRPGTISENTSVTPKILDCQIPGLTGAFWTAQDEYPSPLDEET